MPKSDRTCGNGLPCVFVSAHNWIPYDDSFSYKNNHPPPIKSSSWKDEKSTLFLMIASFRDKLCPKTLFNVFTKSKAPNRIFIGLVQQNLPEDGDCVEQYCELMMASNKDYKTCPFKDNIRIERKDANKAFGPTWARAIGSTLLRDEEFCMQTDAHMDFVSNWDMKMMQMWADTENEYAVLSTYVTDSSELKHNIDGQLGVNGLFEVPHLCMVTFFGSNGLVRNWGTKSCRSLPRPKLTNAVWGAGLSFSKCHAEHKVPYDPHTPGIFDGEEFSRALRYWTWGYDIYTPHRVHVVHDYHVSQADPKHMTWIGNMNQIYSENENALTKIDSATRLKMLIGLHTGEAEADIQALRKSRYGLGDRRTLQQAIDFSGIDTVNQKMTSNRCGNIEYVPFIEHPKGPDYIPKYDPVTEKFIDEYDIGSIYHPQYKSIPAAAISKKIVTQKSINNDNNNKLNKLVKAPEEKILLSSNKIRVNTATENTDTTAIVLIIISCLIALAALIKWFLKKYCNTNSGSIISIASSYSTSSANSSSVGNKSKQQSNSHNGHYAKAV